jgi:hypothetical protein
MASVFDAVLGDPSASTMLTEADMRRVVRRAERLAHWGGHVAHDRAAEQELARQIAEALRMRDPVSARNLIEEATRFGYSHTAMMRAVEEQTQQDRLQAMEAVRRREADPDDRWPGDPDPYDGWEHDEPR